MLKVLWNFLSSIVKIGSPPFFLGVSVAIVISALTFTLLETNLAESFLAGLLATTDESRLDTISNIWGVIAALCASLLVFISILRIIRSSSEKAEQEITSRFSIEEKVLRRKIEAESDKQEKKALEQQASALRQEYESLLSENLQKKDGKFVTDWREVLLVARKRLADEGRRMRLRNAVNLAIGMTSLLVGVVLLSYSLDSDDGLQKGYSFVDFLIAYWSRIGIVLTLGVFSGFFLRLYSLTERIIERNKSDLTNIELRLTSGLMLYEKVNKDNFAILADNLSKEDSKFVLGKNESSGGGGTNKLLETLLKITPKIGG